MKKLILCMCLTTMPYLMGYSAGRVTVLLPTPVSTAPRIAKKTFQRLVDDLASAGVSMRLEGGVYRIILRHGLLFAGNQHVRLSDKGESVVKKLSEFLGCFSDKTIQLTPLSNSKRSGGGAGGLDNRNFHWLQSQSIMQKLQAERAFVSLFMHEQETDCEASKTDSERVTRIDVHLF